MASRLRREARHVFVDEGDQRDAIFDESHITTGQSLSYFSNLRLGKGDIAANVLH